jgi:predicted transcriptional regulator
MTLLRTYRFTEKDLVVDELHTILDDEGLFTRLKHVAELASLHPSTLYNLFHGPTKRPQNATVMAIITSVGYERKFVRTRKLNFDEELVLARAWNKREKAKQENTKPRKRKRA